MTMTPKEECEVLLDKLLPAAQHLLEKNGRFIPIGAVMNMDSEIILTATGKEDYPDPQSIIDALTTAHKRMAGSGEIKISGIAFDGRVTPPGEDKSDAIIISLEHKDNYSVTVFLPYKKGLFKRIKYGEMFAGTGANNIFIF